MDPGGFARTVRAVFKNLPGKGKRAGTRPQAGDGVAGGPGLCRLLVFGKADLCPGHGRPAAAGRLAGAPRCPYSPMPQKPRNTPKKQRSGGCPKRKTAAGKRSDRGAAPLLLAYPFFPALSRGRRIFNRRLIIGFHRLPHGNRPEAGRTEFALHAGTLCAVALHAAALYADFARRPFLPHASGCISQNRP